MTDKEWLDAVGLLGAMTPPHGVPTFDALREALVTAYALMTEAGARPADLYAQVPERELADAAAAQLQAMERGDWVLRFDPGSLGDAVAALGARIRALDRWLKHATPTHGPPVQIEAETLSDAGWYVVPRLTARIARAGHGGRASFQQRGTLDHRLIPAQVGSYTIGLRWLGDIAERDTPGLLGAAMFDDFSVDLDQREKSFSASGIACPNAIAQIQAAVASVAGDNCQLLAFPELTMRPAIELVALVDALRAGARTAAEAATPDLTLAGSWHVDGANGCENAAPVLDGIGREVLRHVKSRQYSDNEHGLEAIVPSYHVDVLVTQEQLIAFGICKDFCDARPGLPYPLLNVDLVVVGSMGNHVTMAGHIAAANDLAALGTATFVVQQDLATGRGDTGWVLPPSKTPGLHALEGLRRPSWSVHPQTRVN